MAESIVQVTEGSGKKLHTNSYTVGANTVEDEFTVPGEYPYASYFVEGQTVSIATAASHVLQIMAGASLKVRVRRLRIEQMNNATAASVVRFEILRLTSAGTGGTAVTPRPFDTADAAAGAAAMTLSTAKGTEGVSLGITTLVMRQAVLATAAQMDDGWEWTQLGNTKGIVIPTGTTNGIVIKSIDACAGATVHIWAEIVETAF